MIRTRHAFIAVLLFAASLGVAQASWYDDYDDGITAARKGQWSTVVQKMTAAINGNRNENDRTRTYGAIFINYHPYYYRAAAYLNLGKYEQAISDFEKTSGAGEVDLGSIDTLMQRAKSKLAAANAPEPVTPPPAPVPQPQPRVPPPAPAPAPVPLPVQPSGPTIDPAVRLRAQTAVDNAKRRLAAAAQQRRATGSPQYTQALQGVTQANTQLAAARTNDDLNRVAAVAENAGMLADSSAAPAQVAAAPPPRQVSAANAILADYQPQLRRALQSYFAGEFEDAARDFEQLSQTLPTNGWVWAFLGASQYSRYAFEADEQYKSKAEAAFKKAKALRFRNSGLPEKYFSRKIRKFFAAM
jgi:tetratricopeptide (TPR) repeat protein